MEDFNDYANNSEEFQDKNLFNLVNSIAAKYDGKSQNELLAAIYKEAQKGKRAGTLTNTEIDNFAKMLTDVSEQHIAEFLAWLDAFSAKENITFTLSMTMDPETACEDIKKYAI